MKFTVFLTALACVLLASGCAMNSEIHRGRYFQKNPVTVAIVPATNDTEGDIDASMLLDKIWETALKEAGYSVVNADEIVTYISASGMTLMEIQNVTPSQMAEIGRELSVDYFLCNHITEWGSHFEVIRSKTKVSCESVLYEASTGAVVWEETWAQSNDSDLTTDVASTLVGAVAHRVMSSITREEINLAGRGIEFVSKKSLPRPGFAK